MKFKEIVERAHRYLPEMTQFLRDMVRIPSESCHEKEVILRIDRKSVV